LSAVCDGGAVFYKNTKNYKINLKIFVKAHPLSYNRTNEHYMKLLLLGLGFGELLLLLVTLFVVVPIASYWKIFEKAEQPGWAAIIPLYNLIVLMKIVDKPWYWSLFCCIPCIGFLWAIWSNNLLVKRFGKTAFFTIGVVLQPFVFLPILAFGNTQYIKE
jgi:hypothetical protein